MAYRRLFSLGAGLLLLFSLAYLELSSRWARLSLDPYTDGLSYRLPGRGLSLRELLNLEPQSVALPECGSAIFTSLPPKCVNQAGERISLPADPPDPRHRPGPP